MDEEGEWRGNDGRAKSERRIRKKEENSKKVGGETGERVTEELRRGISGDRCSASERESNAIKRLRCLVRGELPLEDIRGKIEKRRRRKKERQRETRG